MESAADGIGFSACAGLGRLPSHGPRPYCQRAARELAGLDVRKQLVGFTLPRDASDYNYDSGSVGQSERQYTKRCFRPTGPANTQRVIDVKSRHSSSLGRLQKSSLNPFYTCSVRGCSMTTRFSDTGMRPIWFRRQWSPRATIVFTVLDAIVTGFCLGLTLFAYLRGHDPLSWMTPLVIAFASAVGALRGTLIALRNCPQPTKPTESELRGARA
jgi:hypothetical protein